MIPLQHPEEARQCHHPSRAWTYVEHPGLWPGFHNLLIANLAEDLSPRVRPRYYVAVEQRVCVAEAPGLVGRPDASVVIARPSGRSATATLAREADHAPASSGVQVHAAVLPMPDRIRETYLEVREAATSEVVTVVEILSPTNKLPGRGRREYEDKRLETLGTRTHLAEIDLLRAGPPMPAQLQSWPVGAPPPGDASDLRSGRAASDATGGASAV
jgi:hypothetical protein